MDVGTKITDDAPKTLGDEGFNAMGKPIPAWRRAAAYDTARQWIGVNEERLKCVDRMANALERDQPHLAISIGMEYVDLTATYRLMAELLSAPKPRVRVPARRRVV